MISSAGLVFFLVLDAVVFALAGRQFGRRPLLRELDALDAQDAHITKDLPRPGPARSDGAGVDPGPGELLAATQAFAELSNPPADWQVQMATDLAPAALDAENEQLEEGSPYCGICDAWHQPDNHPDRPCYVPEPAGIDGRIEQDSGLAAMPEDSGGLGHFRASPYGPNPTPAQRRRDKHKHRGPYAPAGSGHWYAEQLHGLADWQAAWHAEAAWFDEVWLPGYVEWYGRGLEPGVGLRRILEAAA